jgi:DNA-binding NtrC family response regulator
MKRTGNVLVVDDEKVVCNSCKKILTQEGYNVDIALSGEEALKKVKRQGIDVVITDWKMPEIDGMEVARRIKKENPNVTVIMITGYPSVESTIKALRLGISDYVPKPFTPEELTDAVVHALEKGQAVPTDLVTDMVVNRLVEKGVLVPEAKSEVKEAVKQEAIIAPAVTPMPLQPQKANVVKSGFAAFWSRLFFVALGPIVLFTIVSGIFKVLFGKKPLQS